MFDITTKAAKVFTAPRGSTNHTLDNVEFNGGSYGVYAYDASFEIFNNLHSTVNKMLVRLWMLASIPIPMMVSPLPVTSVSSYGVQCQMRAALE